MKKILFVFFIFYFHVFELYSQNIEIKGRVISDDFRTVSLASIMINDTIEVGKTNMDGFFLIDVPISCKKVSFIFIGLESTRIELKDNCNQIEIVMMRSSSYDFMTLKKVDRLRMKRFKKLPELHRNAFEKGLFKTDRACYIQDFIPNYNKKW